MAKRNLYLSYLDAFFFSIMVGAGESYLPAYALSVGMGETLAGFFSSVPLIAGAVIQLVTPWLIRKIGSVKKWVVFAVSIQALSFLPLVAFNYFPKINFLSLFLIASIYFGAGFAAGPPWNYWMGEIVPENISANFFSVRTRITQMGIFSGLVAGGLALHKQIQVGPFTTAFSLLFFVAFLSRAGSGLALFKKSYESRWSQGLEKITLVDGIKKFFEVKEYKLLFGFLFLFYMSIMISSPFVNPYFLKQLNYNYLQYMIAQAILLAAKIVSLTLAPRAIQRFGVRTVFLVGVIGLSPIPAFWGVSQNYWFGLILQSSSGFFWGLFDVALTVLFFQNILKQEKIPVLTLYNFFNSAAVILGTSIGGHFLHSLGENFQAYHLIFLLSSFLRLVFSIGFARMSMYARE